MCPVYLMLRSFVLIEYDYALTMVVVWIQSEAY